MKKLSQYKDVMVNVGLSAILLCGTGVVLIWIGLWIAVLLQLDQNTQSSDVQQVHQESTSPYTIPTPPKQDLLADKKSHPFSDQPGGSKSDVLKTKNLKQNRKKGRNSHQEAIENTHELDRNVMRHGSSSVEDNEIRDTIRIRDRTSRSSRYDRYSGSHDSSEEVTSSPNDRSQDDPIDEEVSGNSSDSESLPPDRDEINSDDEDITDLPTDSVEIQMVTDQECLPESGEIIEVAVYIKDVTNLGGFQFDIYYDPDIISVNESGAVLGTTIESSGRSVSILGPQIKSGRVTSGCFSFGDQPGFNGSGNLMTLIFTVKGGGESSLSLRNITLTDTDAHTISVGNIQNDTIRLVDCW